jgi:hypothetical protein
VARIADALEIARITKHPIKVGVPVLKPYFWIDNRIDVVDFNVLYKLPALLTTKCLNTFNDGYSSSLFDASAKG